MKLTFCGGAGEVGASCILINIDGKKILFKNPNQNEIIKTAKEICSSFGISAVKNPSIFTLDRLVKVKINEEIDESIKELCSRKFKEETGYDIMFI